MQSILKNTTPDIAHDNGADIFGTGAISFLAESTPEATTLVLPVVGRGAGDIDLEVMGDAFVVSIKAVACGPMTLPPIRAGVRVPHASRYALDQAVCTVKNGLLTIKVPRRPSLRVMVAAG